MYLQSHFYHKKAAPTPLLPSSRFIRANCLSNLLPANWTHLQSFCAFQTAADVRAGDEDHVCCTIQANLQKTL